MLHVLVELNSNQNSAKSLQQEETAQLTAEKTELKSTINSLKQQCSTLEADNWNLTLFNLFTITLSMTILYLKW